MKPKQLLFLCDEIMPYFEVIFEQLAINYQCKIIAVEITKRKRTVYKAGRAEYYEYYQKEKFSNFEREIITLIQPDLVYVAGWVNWDYLKVCRYFKKKNVKIVCGIDNWRNFSIKGVLKEMLLSLCLKRFITNVWIPGIPQYDFVRKLGFSREKIIWNLYTANTKIFSSIQKDIQKRKNILFVGRLELVKGIDILLSTFQKIASNFPEWNLILIGDGTFKDTIPIHNQIKHYPFMSATKLTSIAEDCSIFALPSRNEPWGLVIHEFASKGLALLTSDACGASSSFVINGYNGYTFKTEDEKDLEQKLTDMLSLNFEELGRYCSNSVKLSKNIYPELSAASLMAII